MKTAIIPVHFSDNYVDTNQKNMLTYSLITSSNCFGQIKSGVEHGPQALTKHPYFNFMLNDIIPSSHPWVCSLINHNTYTKMNNCEDYQIESMNNLREVDSVVRHMYSDNVISSIFSDMTINLMGDHSAAIGTVLGSANTNINNTILVWIDSKPDIETPMTSMYGNMNEMQIGFMTSLIQKSMPIDSIYSELFPFVGQMFPMENIIYVGCKNQSLFAEKIIKENQIMVIDENSSYETMIKFENKIRKNNIHISCDVSIFSQKCFPCANSPLRGDMSPQFVSHIISQCAGIGNIKTLDIAEFNPTNASIKAINNCVSTITDNLIYPAMGFGYTLHDTYMYKYW
jgi:arginase family enzyme